MRALYLTLTAGVLCSLLAKAQNAAVLAKGHQNRVAPTEFIRAQQNAEDKRLQTAITRYAKGNTTVDLIGAVHIADTAYYQSLDKSFQDYQVVLFEMVGGEQLGQGRPIPKAANNEGALGFLSSAYQKAQDMLELSGQKDHIDYSAPNFIHADLTLDEFHLLQEQRGESILSFALKQALSSSSSSKQPSSASLLIALLTQDANRLKRIMIDTLGEGDTQIAKLAGENVIIGDRNKKCLAVMEQQINLGKNHLAIFYGAAHFPDMEKRLIDRGFQKQKQSWLDAWVVPNP